MKNNLVIGDTVDGATLVVKKENLSLWKGLQFEDGSIKWLMAQYVGNFCCGLAAVDFIFSRQEINTFHTGGT